MNRLNFEINITCTYYSYHFFFKSAIAIPAIPPTINAPALISYTVDLISSTDRFWISF